MLARQSAGTGRGTAPGSPQNGCCAVIPGIQAVWIPSPTVVPISATPGMENQRIILWATLLFLLWMMYQAWQDDYAPTPSTPTVGEQPAQAGDALPDLPEPGEAPAIKPAPEGMPALETESSVRGGGTVTVSTDVLEVEISTVGASLTRVSLPEYPIKKGEPDKPVVLLNDEPATRFLMHSGLRGSGGTEPNHRAPFSTGATEYRLAEGDDELKVVFDWVDGGGLAAEKVFTFTRGSYAIELEQTLVNRSGEDWRGAPYMQIQRRNVPQERSMFDVDTFSFTGPVIYDGEKYDKLDVDDLADEPVNQTVTGGWIAAIQHYFLVAAVPPGEQSFNYQARLAAGDYLISEIGPAEVVPAGETRTFTQTLWLGPKLQADLEKIAPGLELTVDYGVLTVLAKPLFWLLQKVYQFLGNWGWSIIVVTFLIKLVFYKLTETQGRSMAKMRKLQPRLKNLQERYKDDKQALSKGMMDLYKREKVNPAAGCLPILIQIPVFLSFYWVLLESAELRQAPFMLWITDISSRDPFFILPVLMGAAMFGQFKLNPTPTTDPVQAKVFMIMPLIMTGMMAFFPAGLVLYWLTNTLLSIAQQWHINKKLGA